MTHCSDVCSIPSFISGNIVCATYFWYCLHTVIQSYRQPTHRSCCPSHDTIYLQASRKYDWPIPNLQLGELENAVIRDGVVEWSWSLYPNIIRFFMISYMKYTSQTQFVKYRSLSMNPWHMCMHLTPNENLQETHQWPGLLFFICIFKSMKQI